MKEEMGQLGVVKAYCTFEIAITQTLQKGDVMCMNILNGHISSSFTKLPCSILGLSRATVMQLEKMKANTT